MQLCSEQHCNRNKHKKNAKKANFASDFKQIHHQKLKNIVQPFDSTGTASSLQTANGEAKSFFLPLKVLYHANIRCKY